MQDKIKNCPKGYVEIKDSLGNILFEGHNALTASAPEVQIKALVGSTEVLNRIAVFNNGVEKSIKPISVITFPETYKTKMVAMFDEDSFTGAFDEIKLVSISNKVYSTKTFTELSKAADKSISISWTLTIE